MEIRRDFELSDNENITHQTLWDVAKAVLMLGLGQELYEMNTLCQRVTF